MRRVVAILVKEDGEGAQEDEGNTKAKHGDLVSLETSSLGGWLGGGLKGQDAFEWMTRQEVGETRTGRSSGRVLTVDEATDGQTLEQGVEPEPAQGGRVVAQDDHPCR